MNYFVIYQIDHHSLSYYLQSCLQDESRKDLTTFTKIQLSQIPLEEINDSINQILSRFYLI